MYNIGSQTRLTDSLERQLLADAITVQMQYRPFEAIGKFFSRMIDMLNREENDITKAEQAA